MYEELQQDISLHDDLNNKDNSERETGATGVAYSPRVKHQREKPRRSPFTFPFNDGGTAATS